MQAFRLFHYLLGCVLDRYDYLSLFFSGVFICIIAFIVLL